MEKTHLQEVPFVRYLGTKTTLEHSAICRHDITHILQDRVSSAASTTVDGRKSFNIFKDGAYSSSNYEHHLALFLRDCMEPRKMGWAGRFHLRDDAREIRAEWAADLANVMKS